MVLVLLTSGCHSFDPTFYPFFNPNFLFLSYIPFHIFESDTSHSHPSNLSLLLFSPYSPSTVTFWHRRILHIPDDLGCCTCIRYRIASLACSAEKTETWLGIPDFVRKDGLNSHLDGWRRHGHAVRAASSGQIDRLQFGLQASSFNVLLVSAARSLTVTLTPELCCGHGPGCPRA